MKPTLIGIDTLHLNPIEWELGANFSAKIQPAPFESGTGESGANHRLYSVAGRDFYGARALKQLDSCVLEFNPYSDRATGVGRVSTKVNVTVPKVASGDNYCPADRRALKDALRIVEAELRDAGFLCNLRAALVKRADLARTIQLLERWLVYRPALAALSPSRMSGRGFESGHRWQNSQRQSCLYEKGEEIASRFPRRERAAAYARYPANSVRAEPRLMERASFQAATGMRTAGDILQDFGHIQGVYRAEWGRVFRFAPSEVERLSMEALSVDGIAAEMARIIDSGERYWLRAWVLADWAANRVVDADRLETIKAAVRKVQELRGLAPQNVAKKQRELEELFLEHARLLQAPRTVGDLYAELRDKVLAA